MSSDVFPSGFTKPVITQESIVSFFGTGVNVTALAPGATSVLFVAPFDVRQFVSYYLSVLIRRNGGAPGNVMTGQIILEFVSDPNSTASLHLEGWEAFALQTGGGAFDFGGDCVQISDNMHGPYLKLSVKNTSAAGNMDFVVNMFGSTRLLPGQIVKHRDAGGELIDGQLLASSDGVNTGTTLTKQARLGVGTGWMSWFAGQVFTIALFAGSSTPAFTSFITAVNERGRMFIPLPKRAFRATVTNNSGVNSFVDLRIAEEYLSHG